MVRPDIIRIERGKDKYFHLSRTLDILKPIFEFILLENYMFRHEVAHKYG
jgi:hypothetical protein